MSLLTTVQLKSYYGDFQALYGIDFRLEPGETVAIIGSNGAGKSTFLKTLVGLLKAPADAVQFEGKPIGSMAPGAIARLGLALVPEGRRLFASLSVEENLLMGAHSRRPGPWNLARVQQLFPILKERRSSPSTALSGGQQQMVAIGRALMSNPKVLLCDELSLGLAPIVIREIYQALPMICGEGVTAVIVEQDVTVARRVSQRLYCFQEGRVSLSANSDSVSKEQISKAYFGV